MVDFGGWDMPVQYSGVLDEHQVKLRARHLPGNSTLMMIRLKEVERPGFSARRIGKLKVTFILHTGETGKAFGSITANDLAERLKQELSRDIDRHLLVLEHPIKTTGEHEVPLKLHHGVTAKFKFNVKSSEEPKLEAPAEESADKSRGPRKHTK